MKNLLSKGFIFVLLTVGLTSCTTVDPGHKGIEVSWGGETNMTTIYPEGMHSGLNWIWDDMIEYDVREHTIVKVFEFNDKNDMVTRVKLALDYSLNPAELANIHTKINDINVKIETSLSSAAKEVVPQYSATDLNRHQRGAAEKALSKILSEELPEFYVQFKRVRVTDVDIPKAVSELATETAVQIGRNELASKKEEEQKNLASARIAKSKGDFESAQYDAKTKDILSQPKMLELQRVENERIMAEGYRQHGKSVYGENNYFGAGAPVLLKSLKNN